MNEPMNEITNKSKSAQTSFICNQIKDDMNKVLSVAKFNPSVADSEFQMSVAASLVKVGLLGNVVPVTEMYVVDTPVVRVPSEATIVAERFRGCIESLADTLADTLCCGVATGEITPLVDLLCEVATDGDCSFARSVEWCDTFCGGVWQESTHACVLCGMMNAAEIANLDGMLCKVANVDFAPSKEMCEVATVESATLAEMLCKVANVGIAPSREMCEVAIVEIVTSGEMFCDVAYMGSAPLAGVTHLAEVYCTVASVVLCCCCCSNNVLHCLSRYESSLLCSCWLDIREGNF